MNLRITIIEAQDVTASDIEAMLPRITGAQPAPALPAVVDAPTLPPARMEPPVANLPDPSIRQMAAMPKVYRPRAPRTRAATKEEARPVVARKMSCRGCGFDAPDGTDGRSRCPKCSGRWETVPERIDVLKAAGLSNDESDE
jgi:hypothetical protein